MGEWASGRVGEWESGRVGEWASGRVGEWESGRVLISIPVQHNHLNIWMPHILRCLKFKTFVQDNNVGISKLQSLLV